MSIIDRIRALFGGGPSSGVAGNGGSPDARTAGAGEEMISCEEALRLVQEYLDGELTGVDEAKVKAHFDVCQRCYPHLQLEGAYRDAVRRAGSGERAPAELRSRVVALIAEAHGEG